MAVITCNSVPRTHVDSLSRLRCWTEDHW